MPTYRISLSTVSWIERSSLAQYAPMPVNPMNLVTRDGWLRMIAYGLEHTANTDPPDPFDPQPYVKGQVLGSQFRALTTCVLGVRISATGVFEGLTSLAPSVAPDPGYTPPFDQPGALRMGAVAQELVRNLPLYHDIMAEGTRFSPGEASSLSTISQPAPLVWSKTAAQPLSYGSLRAGVGETVLAHSLVKFRAGAAGDRIGILAFRAPNHVPWVWCEAMLTLSGSKLVLYGAGSGFPSHAFYVGGRRRGTITQAASMTELDQMFRSGLTAHIGWKNLRPDQVNPQAPMQEAPTNQPIGAQPYTAPAIRQLAPVSIDLGTLPRAE